MTETDIEKLSSIGILIQQTRKGQKKIFGEVVDEAFILKGRKKLVLRKIESTEK